MGQKEDGTRIAGGAATLRTTPEVHGRFAKCTECSLAKTDVRDCVNESVRALVVSEIACMTSQQGTGILKETIFKF